MKEFLMIQENTYTCQWNSHIYDGKKELKELEVFEKEHHKLDQNTMFEFDIDKNVVAKQTKAT